MGKRYYCDYCNRHFIDDLEARKKHISGMIHTRLKIQHYNQFKDAKTKYREEREKPPCKRFQRFKECAFGSNCKYSHCSREEMELLRRRAWEETAQQAKNNIGTSEFDADDFQVWMLKLAEERVVEDPTYKRLSFTFKYPESFRNKWGLPPSLQPIKMEDFTCSDYETWG